MLPNYKNDYDTDATHNNVAALVIAISDRGNRLFCCNFIQHNNH